MKPSNDILEELSALRRADAKAREASVPLAEMMRRAADAPTVRDFAAAFAGEGVHVIAELKRASPSEGMIREDFRPVELARELVDERYLADVRRDAEIPVLYKDFITTRYQVATARAAGADAVLLIAAVLDDAALADLLGFARSFGMEALVETHDAQEIARAVSCGAKVVGVNCRNLRNFATDVSLLEALVGEIPAGCVRIAESGMHTAEAVSRAKAAGADGFLVGTALMRAARPGTKLKDLIS